MRSFAWVVTREYGCLVFFPHGLGREKGMFSAKTLDFFFFLRSCNFQVCFYTISMRMIMLSSKFNLL